MLVSSLLFVWKSVRRLRRISGSISSALLTGRSIS